MSFDRRRRIIVQLQSKRVSGNRRIIFVKSKISGMKFYFEACGEKYIFV